MSTTTIKLDEKTYGKLLGRTLPHVIRTDEECERLTNELLRLDEREDLSPEETELAKLLTVLIDEYEERRYPIRKASPQQTLQHLMEARKLTQKDLWKVFGSRGITSEVFHGKRSKLAAFFHLRNGDPELRSSKRLEDAGRRAPRQETAGLPVKATGDAKGAPHKAGESPSRLRASRRYKSKGARFRKRIL